MELSTVSVTAFWTFFPNDDLPNLGSTAWYTKDQRDQRDKEVAELERKQGYDMHEKYTRDYIKKEDHQSNT